MTRVIDDIHSSDIPEVKLASQQEFADILGVDRSTVTHAIRGKRLKNSVVKVGTRKKIMIYQGCVEWYLKKHIEKDRKTDLTPEIEKSRAVREHYRSLLTKQEYEVKSCQLVSVDEVAKKGAEICLAARRYLEDRREKDSFKLPLAENDFEARKLLRERDDGFLRELSQLKSVADAVLKGEGEDFGEEAEEEQSDD